MKVLVFAHVPPPNHGQSYMIQLMLDNLGHTSPGNDKDLVLYHVNARLSDGVEDIGSYRFRKVFRLAKYVLQAWWMRWKYSIDAFYYVPAPAKLSALTRDWIVLAFAASAFKIRIFHWHATGLGSWVAEGETAGPVRRWEAWITKKLVARHDLSCVLNDWGRNDIAVFSPRRIAVVPNGIPDPCPDFIETILPRRLRRLEERSTATETRPVVFELLFLAHATRAKGLFDAIDAVARTNAKWAVEQSGRRIRLTVAGAFVSNEEERLFLERINADDLRLAGLKGDNARAVLYAGYAGPGEKDQLLRQADALCFASYFPNEGQPVSVIEALAYGLPVVLARWRALPEMLPSTLAHLVKPADPEQLAQALPILACEARFEAYRNHYLLYYALAAHCQRLRAALLSVAPGSSYSRKQLSLEALTSRDAPSH